MTGLLTLAVAFAGIGGKGAEKIERQVHAMLDLGGGVQDVKVSKKQCHTLASTGAGARDLVESLSVDGLVAGELADGTLQLVVYKSDGGVLDLIDLPVDHGALGKADIQSLREAILPDVARLAKDSQPEIEIDDSADSDAAADSDDAGPVAAADAADADADADADATDDSADAADTEVAMADDSAADDDIVDWGAGSTDSDDVEASLHLRASAGFGFLGRTFNPGPSTIPSYVASPTAAVRVFAEVEPDPRFAVDVQLDRTVVLNSTVGNGTAPSSILRWQADAAYRRPIGKAAIGAVLGYGTREFVIESHDPSRTPDGHYGYLVVGTRADLRIGSRVSLRGVAALEPVVAGAESTAMSFGPATRWALEVGATVEVAATDHVYVSGGADYQRFQWSFDRAGMRGAGGATDEYPSATLAVGARY